MALNSLTPWRDKNDPQKNEKRHKQTESLLCLVAGIICLAVAFLPASLPSLTRGALLVSLLVLLGGLLTVGGQFLRSYDEQRSRADLIVAGLRRYIIVVSALIVAGYLAYRYFMQ